jgi:CRP-like cAMP-binding protein
MDLADQAGEPPQEPTPQSNCNPADHEAQPYRPSTFWGLLKAADQRSFTALAQQRTFCANEVVFRAGEHADHVILIRSGWTKVCVDQFDGERIVALRGPGELIGERAALRVSERSATVIALDDVQALTMDTEKFAVFLGAHPHLNHVIAGQVHERLEQQLAFLILNLLRRQGQAAGPTVAAALPITARDLAHWVHEPQPSVERVLAGWRKLGVVRVTQGRLIVSDVWELRRICGKMARTSQADEWPPIWTGQNCSTLLTDIAEFSAHFRTDNDRKFVRQAMYELLEDACDGSSVPWPACHHEDRGDGALLVVPPTTPTGLLIDPLLLHLAAGLRRYNRQAGDPIRMQLRVALTVGPVVSDANGVTGVAINRAARLLNSEALKRRLSDTGADLGFIAPEFVYENVIQHTTDRLESTDFEQVRVRNKETEVTAWIYLAGPRRHGQDGHSNEIDAE